MIPLMQLWLKTEGTDGIHVACGSPESVATFQTRYMKAGIVTETLMMPCCGRKGLPCVWDVDDEELERARLVASCALARAEGRWDKVHYLSQLLVPLDLAAVSS